MFKIIHYYNNQNHSYFVVNQKIVVNHKLVVKDYLMFKIIHYYNNQNHSYYYLFLVIFDWSFSLTYLNYTNIV